MASLIHCATMRASTILPSVVTFASFTIISISSYIVVALAQHALGPQAPCAFKPEYSNDEAHSNFGTSKCIEPWITKISPSIMVNGFSALTPGQTGTIGQRTTTAFDREGIKQKLSAKLATGTFDSGHNDGLSPSIIARSPSQAMSLDEQIEFERRVKSDYHVAVQIAQQDRDAAFQRYEQATDNVAQQKAFTDWHQRSRHAREYRQLAEERSGNIRTLTLAQEKSMRERAMIQQSYGARKMTIQPPPGTPRANSVPLGFGASSGDLVTRQRGSFTVGRTPQNDQRGVIPLSNAGTSFKESPGSLFRSKNLNRPARVLQLKSAGISRPATSGKKATSSTTKHQQRHLGRGGQGFYRQRGPGDGR